MDQSEKKSVSISEKERIELELSHEERLHKAKLSADGTTSRLTIFVSALAVLATVAGAWINSQTQIQAAEEKAKRERVEKYYFDRKNAIGKYLRVLMNTQRVLSYSCIQEESFQVRALRSEHARDAYNAYSISFQEMRIELTVNLASKDYLQKLEKRFEQFREFEKKFDGEKSLLEDCEFLTTFLVELQRESEEYLRSDTFSKL